MLDQQLGKLKLHYKFLWWITTVYCYHDTQTQCRKGQQRKTQETETFIPSLPFSVQTQGRFKHFLNTLNTSVFCFCLYCLCNSVHKYTFKNLQSSSTRCWWNKLKHTQTFTTYLNPLQRAHWNARVCLCVVKGGQKMEYMGGAKVTSGILKERQRGRERESKWTLKYYLPLTC